MLPLGMIAFQGIPPSVDTSATRDEISRTISSTTTTESPEVVRQLEMINKTFQEMKQMQSVKSVDTKCETCGGPHSYTECPAIGGYTQEAAYANTGNHNSRGNSYQQQVDYDVDPRVPLILRRPFLRMARALIDVHDVACEEYAQEVLGSLDSSTSGNPTPSDSIIASYSPSFNPFEVNILYLEKLLNEDPSSNPPPLKNDDLNQVDVTMTKPSIEELPELELKDLPSHLEYAFLEGTDKLPVIISKQLKDEEKAALLKVLKSHKRAITWKIFDIKGIDPRCCTNKILMEDDPRFNIKEG
uniref:Reverse transcriptase domain-containing protein n=1 Tax=Tanacetum cinerariifolium TaxID=118510 RepID=A0A6L2LME7_TANCI|nr:hypothetical protein [Tanacetum cinerariifolium]